MRQGVGRCERRGWREACTGRMRRSYVGLLGLTGLVSLHSGPGELGLRQIWVMGFRHLGLANLGS